MKKKDNKSDIIVPETGKIITPETAANADKMVNTMLTIPFTFMMDDSMDKIIDELDQKVTDERNKAIVAIGKMKGIEVNLEGEN